MKRLRFLWGLLAVLVLFLNLGCATRNLSTDVLLISEIRSGDIGEFYQAWTTTPHFIQYKKSIGNQGLLKEWSSGAFSYCPATFAGFAEYLVTRNAGTYIRGSLPTPIGGSKSFSLDQVGFCEPPVAAKLHNIVIEIGFDKEQSLFVTQDGRQWTVHPETPQGQVVGPIRGPGRDLIYVRFSLE